MLSILEAKKVWSLGLIFSFLDFNACTIVTLNSPKPTKLMSTAPPKLSGSVFDLWIR